MSPGFSFNRRWISGLQACGLGFILAGLILSEAAAFVNFVSKVLVKSSQGPIFAGILLYFLLAGISLWVLHWIFRKHGAKAFLWSLGALVLLLQLAVIGFANRSWTWTGDSLIFNQYLSELTNTGYVPATLERLSQYYDYRVWTRRALPFYYLLRLTTGSSFMPAVQIFQALAIMLSLVLTWRITRLFFGPRTALWTVGFQFIMPFRWFICLDLNHHILGGLYFLTGLWILAEWMRGKRRLFQTMGLTVAAVILLPLMRLEGGIDSVFMGATFLVLLLAWLGGRQTAGQTLRSSLSLLLLPMLAAKVLLSPLDRRIDAADQYHHESGAIAFMARGWAPETGGEYCGTYETIDYITAGIEKKTVQASILASQAFYNPRALLLHLLPEKMAKYFLLGYASGAEEMLAQNGAYQTQVLAEGARTAFLLAMLPWMIWGGYLLLPRLRRNRLLPLVIPCALLGATYVLLGETSPRYSFYIQPFLFMLAAQPLVLTSRRRHCLCRAGFRPAAVTAIILGGTLLLTAAGLAATRPILARWTLQDLRTWNAHGANTISIPATLTPFEIILVPQTNGPGTTWGPIQIPALTPSPRFVSFYALPVGARSPQLQNTKLLAEAASAVQTNSLPARIRLAYPPSGLGEVRFRSETVFPYPLRIGYATYEFHEKAIE